MARLNFKVEGECPGTRARAGRLTTLHGEVATPVFMPVGTQATVKSQTVETLRTTGSSILLANTYHLMLRPGIEVFRKMGGIHRFKNWTGPILTDSGGFQIFSLPGARSMTEEGARFRSYVDGSQVLMSPETSIEMQKAIGSDIMMVLDQCIPSTAEHPEAKAAMELTHRWAKRSLAARGDSPQSMFGIVQGACFQDLRRQSADVITSLPFDGFAIGGLAVGESKQQREDFTEWTANLLPRDFPRYLMGVGTPIDILEAVHRGVDMFDCIIPSAFAQRGAAFTSRGKLQLRRSVYKFADEPLDPDCGCDTCANYSKAYLHHLHKCDEVLGWSLIGTHNLWFYHQMMREIRSHILAGTFLDYYRSKREVLIRHDEDLPLTPAVPPAPRREKLRRMGDYEIVDSPAGHSNIRQIRSGETTHSMSAPIDEAQRLFVEPSGLREKLREASGGELVIWDVGLGAAANAMATLQCFEKAWAEAGAAPSSVRPVHLVSFERDLRPLRLAALAAAKFPYLKHAAPHLLLKEGSWAHPTAPFRWTLIKGDFIDEMTAAPAPDVIYYDPFFDKTEAALGSPETLARLRACGGPEAELFSAGL